MLLLLPGPAARLAAQPLEVLINTTVAPNVTTNDSVNDALRVIIGIRLIVTDPKPLTNRGLAIVHNQEVWYLHVVRTNRVVVGTAPLVTREADLLLAVASNSPQLPDSVPPRLHTSALYMLAVLDETDSLPLYADLEDTLQDQVDSLAGWAADVDSSHPTFVQFQTLRDSLKATKSRHAWWAWLAKLKKRPRRLARFFLGPHFRQSLKYHPLTAPYGLPKWMVPPPPVPVKVPTETPKYRPIKFKPPNYKQDKYDRRGFRGSGFWQRFKRLFKRKP